MKKYILGIAVIATVAIAGWNYQQNQESVVLSDLALENIEALATGESDDEFYEKTGCHATICYKECGPHVYASRTHCNCPLCN